MFTIKFRTGDGYRTIIKEAESFSILRADSGDGAEITLHQKSMVDDSRVDILPALHSPRPEGHPPVFQVAFIENAMGKTVEIIGVRSL